MAQCAPWCCLSASRSLAAAGECACVPPEWLDGPLALVGSGVLPCRWFAVFGAATIRPRFTPEMLEVRHSVAERCRVHGAPSDQHKRCTAGQECRVFAFRAPFCTSASHRATQSPLDNKSNSRRFRGTRGPPIWGWMGRIASSSEVTRSVPSIFEIFRRSSALAAMPDRTTISCRIPASRRPGYLPRRP